MTPIYRVMHADEVLDVMDLMSQALHFDFPSKEKSLEWAEKRGLENFRVVEVDGQRAAVMNIIPMGQWFNGVALPSACIAGVGVAPEFRGRNVGKVLMSEMLREMREKGVPLSTLYPATSQFYRRIGYERAGARIIYKTSITSGSLGERSVSFRKVNPAEDGVQEIFKTLYATWAAAQNGFLERGDVMWSGMFEPTWGSLFYYLVEQAGQPVGYIVYAQGNQQDDMRVRDWCGLTPAAIRGLWQFMADHRTMSKAVLWPGAATDPMIHVLPEQEHTRDRRLDWMLRLVNVQTALEQRFYPKTLTANVEIEIIDELFPENAGAWIISVEQGHMTVKKGGSGALQLHIRDLAAIYANYLSARQLQLVGQVHGSAEAALTLEHIFAGPSPWMPDMF